MCPYVTALLRVWQRAPTLAALPLNQRWWKYVQFLA